MGTQVTGRKRIPNKEKFTAEDDALNQIAREAEARLAAKRAARAEAREIRMKELERQQKEISDDEERMSVGSRGSLRPSDYSGFLGSSSRASSRASSARASPVVEERPDRDFIEKGSRTASTLSAATLASLGGASSRRGSCDTSFSVETEASIREMKDSLVESEEKYRKAMVSNAQLHNEKSNLMYQVDTLKESLIELEERLWESQRELSDKAKEFERVRHAHSVLQFQFSETRETLKQSEELLTEVGELRLKRDSGAREISDLQEALEWKEKKIGALERQREYSEAVRTERDLLREQVVRLTDALKKHGIALSPEVTTNGATGDGVLVHSPLCAEPGSRLAQEAQPPHIGGESMLELRLRKLVDERESLVDQVRRLKSQLEQKPRNGTEGPEEEGVENGMDPYIMDLQRDANRQISDFKFKLVKSEQEVTALEQNIIRLEGQVTRYKSASESAEKVEDELKVEKRKLQRELRSALDRIDELEASNSHLSKRLEKMKANRTALLAQQ
ncbi:leucine-rich repeat flightless-interacting protein 2 isoform X2 [Hypomesus transpacificus]|uniref:leucine-rich repeat flightless-interacting protein 2 isoform X2 n=1 Tax=Hypomesus transpacificus TaxID=137520 RepID=UPI001F0767FA|nr:leucine-rich repeat flightless-interacting protein 2 isoform X2 [Hypomesus transpacificus]